MWCKDSFGNIYFIDGTGVWHVDERGKRFNTMNRDEFINYFKDNPHGDTLKHFSNDFGNSLPVDLDTIAHPS